MALAAIDPDRAEVLVKSVSGQAWVPGRAMALVVEALAGSDPERAERMAATIREEQWRAVALATIGRLRLHPAGPAPMQVIGRAFVT